MTSNPSISSSSSGWEKTKAKSREWFNKVGKPVNRLSNKLGAEAFWPMGLGEEADKAARILRSFCIDGFQSEQGGGPDGKQKKQSKSLDHIAPEIIRGAQGLAIFTVMRTGLHWSGAGGSGIVVAKNADGSWSAPTGILIHTLGWGLIAGADIYDCVCVLNTREALAGFTRVRCTVGGEISAAVGPLGAGSGLESQILAKRERTPVWTYTKSRGLYGGVQVDGTVIVERSSENEAFYHRDGVKAQQILQGEVQPPPGSCVQLWETLQAVEGQPYDSNKLPPPNVQTPGDQVVEPPHEKSQAEYDGWATAHQGERMDATH